MHEKFSLRIETALSRLAARVERSRVRLAPNLINRQIGRSLEANQRVAARFDVRLVKSNSPAGLHLRLTHNAAFDDRAALYEGAYVLRSKHRSSVRPTSDSHRRSGLPHLLDFTFRVRDLASPRERSRIAQLSARRDILGAMCSSVNADLCSPPARWSCEKQFPRPLQLRLAALCSPLQQRGPYTRIPTARRSSWPA